jgi:WD40 repeat protein
MTFPHPIPLFAPGVKPSTLLATACLASPFVQLWSVNKTTFTLLSNPATLPAGQGQCLAFNPAGDHLAVGHANSPNMTVYSISGATFTKMANPSNLPAGPAQGIAFSPNGLFLGEGDNGNPQNSVYTYAPGLVRVGSSGNYAGEDTAVAFSPDSSLFVIAANSNSSPFMRIYTVSSGGVISQISNPVSPPSVFCNCVAFNPAGTLCFLGGGSSGFSTSFNLYGVSGTTFTRLSNPSTVPGSTNGINGAAFSPDGKLFVLVTGSSPYIYPYSVSGPTMTYLGSPPVIPATGRVGVSFSRDGKLLALCGQSSPSINMYKVSGTTLTNITAPSGANLNTFGIVFN